ncbi:MAG: T9SS type A sorting domain-containing protein [Deferribacteres bacterium]|nr:T9SS type A sorting domain-containing protein [candidate division KSB1 bacterium]MCB9502800.1 T9SS type A sorting domain-containing protein [Deferribacteres bacterium]
MRLLIVSLSFFAFQSWAQSVNNIPVSVQAQDQILPQSVKVNGGIFLMWIDKQTTTDRLQYIKLAANGLPDSLTLGEFQVPNTRIDWFHLDANSNDYFFVTWAEETNGVSALRVTKIDANGRALWNEPAKLSETSLNFRRPHVTDNLAGGCYVVWQQSNVSGGDNPNDIDLYSQQFNANGSKEWNDNAVIINKTGQQILGEITSLASALVVAWQDGNTVRLGAYSKNSGSAISDQNGIAPGTGFIMQNPKLIHVKSSASAINEEVIVVWEQAGFLNRNKEVYAQKINLNGQLRWGTGGERVSTSSNEPVSPQIVNDEQQGVIIVWQETSAPSQGIYAQRFNTNGDRLWTNSGIQLVGENGYDAAFHIAHDGQQGVYLTWADAQQGNLDIWAQHLAEDQSLDWGEEGIAVSQHNSDQTNPFANVIDDRLFITWQDYRSENNDIYAQFILGDGTLGNVDPVIYSTPIEIAFANVPYVYEIIAGDIDKDTPLTYEMVTGPNWLQIDNSGVLSGTPPVVTPTQSENVKIVVTDSRGATAAQNFMITIETDNTAPRFTSTPVIETKEDELYTYSPTAEDDDGDIVRINAKTIPGWLNFDSTQVLLSGTPLNQNVGDTVVVLLAVDEHGASVEQQFTLTVLNVNDAPVITSGLPPATAIEDSLYSFKVSAVDEDLGDQLTYSLRKAPTWLQIDAISGLLSGTPTSADVGKDSVIITVSDISGAIVVQGYELTVINTNDPPQFLSLPITTAYVDLSYKYTINVVDPDSNDVVKLSLEKGPPWLTLMENVLQGIAPATADGLQFDVQLKAEDNNGGMAQQTFKIEVSSKPDIDAPVAMVDAFVENNSWTSVDSFTVKWKNPADSGSVITTLFVKYLSSPQDSTDFDAQLNVSQSGNSEFVESILTPVTRGHVPFYCWLGDAAGNHDFRTAVQLHYKLDNTKPAQAKPIFPNNWARADTLVFQWIAATDSVSGVSGYEITLNLDETVVLPVDTMTVNGDTLTTFFPMQLDGKLFSWSIAAIDSAGNRISSTELSFTIDSVKPYLQHGFLQTASKAQDLEFLAHATDGLSGIRYVGLLYRSPGGIFSEKGMTGTGTQSESFTCILPANLISATGLEYTIFADDKAGNRTWLEEPNTGLNYKSISISSTGNAAPKTLKNEYQLVSIPFDFSAQQALPYFESIFGKYDDTKWRILKYSGTSYVELNETSFTTLNSGEGFWLITRDAKSWLTKEVNSVLTDEIVSISLQPGWNIIGSPWAWNVTPSAINVPQGVENAFWQWDNGYSIASEGMQPWRGYFILNNTSTEQQITLDFIDKTPLSKKSPIESAEELDWLLQLSIQSGTYSDKSNWFGVGDEPQHISEPPLFDKAPRLFFVEPDTKAELAVCVRSEKINNNSWTFVVDNLQPGEAQITLNELVALPTETDVFLFDVATGIEKRIDSLTPFVFMVSGTSAKRTFLIKTGSARELATEKIPNRLTLDHPWPNPYRISSDGQIKIRFGLPNEANIDLKIYNILGQLVWNSQSSSSFTAGQHAIIWNGRDFSGQQLVSGVYFIKLISGAQIAQEKLVFIR